MLCCNTRARRLARYIDEYAPLPECLPDDAAGAPVGRYLLVQRATGDRGSHWFTLCPGLVEAARYWREQLDPYDWILVAIIDLDDGSELPFAVSLTLGAAPVLRADGAAFTYLSPDTRPPHSAAWPRGLALKGAARGDP